MDCGSLKSLSLPDTTITFAEVVPEGQFKSNISAQQGPPTVELPAYCRVVAVIAPTADSHIETEVWMPTDAAEWNGKLQSVGNGGWTGFINAAAMAGALADGYATASTDTGHKGPRAEFALGHPEKLADFAWRAVHEMTVKAKAIIAAYYGKDPQRSYWNGCSTGGKQGLTEAQRFPADYDGIVAGAPANYWTHLLSWFMYVGKAALADKSNSIPSTKFALLHRAALNACDARDGVKDGVINDPSTCRFDPSVLLCKGGESADCLTSGEVATAKRIYAPMTDPSTGRLLFPGLAPGSEMQWGAPIGGPDPFTIPYDHFQYVVHEDPNWDWHNFDVALDTARADEKDHGLLNAINPNLREFTTHGGKLLLWHGWGDGLITPFNTINYYNQAREANGPAQDSIRLFMVPGMLHCSGGDGPNQFNAVNALDRWVETGIPPAQMIAYRVRGGFVDRSRPLCAYPQVARYSGSGNKNDAGNFVCAASSDVSSKPAAGSNR